MFTLKYFENQKCVFKNLKKHYSSFLKYFSSEKNIIFWFTSPLICKQYYRLKIKKKIWNQFATHIFPTNRLANCLWSPNLMQQKKNRKKLQHRSPASYIFDVGPSYSTSKNCPMNVSYRFS